MLLGPLVPKQDNQLLRVLKGGLADGEDAVPHPVDADRVQLLIEEAFSQLSGEHGELLYN